MTINHGATRRAIRESLWQVWPFNGRGPMTHRHSRIVIPILSISWHGGTRVLIQVANYLASAGYEVVFLVARNRCQTNFEFGAGVSVRNVGVYTGAKLLDYAIFLCCVPFRTGADGVLIASFFLTYFPVRLAAWLRRQPYLYFVQDIESKYPMPRGAILNWLCNWTYRDKKIVAANGYLRERLHNEYGTRSVNISVGPGPIFYDLPPQSQKKYDVIYFLRREPWKGLDRFLRILAGSRGDISCLCVSQDKSLSRVLDGSGAVFRKPDTDRELVECVDSARVLLLTSYHEGFSLPPLEAMARGLPSVLFRCGGPDQYILDERNAKYVDTEDQAVVAIKTLLGDPANYERMQSEAKATADLYRMDKSMVAMARFVAECTDW